MQNRAFHIISGLFLCRDNNVFSRQISVLIILLLCVIPSSKVRAQFNQLFSSDYDLPNTLINEICEDNQQMLWIATEDDLCRYNGSRFITYKNIKGEPNSLSNNFVRTVCADKKGNIAVGTIDGVQVYRPLTDDFTPILTSNSDNIDAANVNKITLLNDGSFLVCGGYSFSLVNDNGEWKVRPNVLTKAVTDVFRAIELKDGSFLVARTPNGLVHVSKQGKVREIFTDNGEKFTIAAFCLSSTGQVYAGSADVGLYTYNAKNNKMLLVPGTEKLAQIYDIKELPGSTSLCIATDGQGVHLYDVTSHSFTNHPQLNSQLVNIHSQKAHSLCFTKNKDMLVGLYQKGILLCAHNTTAFTYIGARSEQYNLIGSCCVTSLLQTHDGNIWTTTDNGGLYGFTSDLVSLRKYPADVRANGVPSTILGLFEDSRNRVWYGSYSRGGGIVDLSSGICQNIYIKGNPNHDFSPYAYVEDKRGQIWVSTMGNGILRYDEVQKEFVPYILNSNLIWTGCMYYDKQHDRLYCGTYNGIYSLSPTDKAKKEKTLVSGCIAYSFSRISADLIAMATNQGLVLYTISTGETRTLTRGDGLPSDNVCAAQNGGDGLLWISTMSGLTRFNLKTMTAETFTYRDGLQGNEFYKNASIITNDGRLWFGGINGITVFTSKGVDQTKTICKVRVVDVRAGEYYLNVDEDGEYVIRSGIERFTISFATMPLFMTRRVSYSYSIDGKDWELLPAPQNRVTFDNLGYGRHKLRLKTTIEGKESEVSETIIYICYPWYLKWWMVIIWILLLCCFAYYLRKIIIKMRYQRERELRHKQEEELQETKLQFFMNVVHDLRTPLTLIATPLQKLRKTDSDTARQHLYDIMIRNAHRLLRLTNEIMDLRKIDSGKMELNLHRSLISHHIQNIVRTMSDIAETRHQELTIKDNTDGTIQMAIDEESFEKILTNLLSNAIKYTPEGGHILVMWNYGDPNMDPNLNINPNFHYKGNGNSCLVLSVTDDGMGIPDSEKKHIFERFYQVRIKDKHVKGTGIGLNLVKALVELHKGEIFVNDNPDGKGTRFTVIIPDDKVALKTLTLSENDNISEEVESQDIVSSVSTSTPEPKAQTSTILRSRPTVLIVDDDDDIRNFLCEEMSTIYNVLDSANGAEAYDVLNKNKVDLVISDVMMPGVDGIELTRMIRKNVRLAHLPIILLTAKASDQDRLEGLQTTADAYVTKPFHLELLEIMASNLLLRQEKLRNTFSGNELPADRIETPDVQSADDKLMERLLKVINDNLANPDLTSEMLANEVGLSRVHMYRKLKELTNQSATNYIRNIRLTKAAELLSENRASVSEVAYLVGFRTPNHFSTAFKELYGVSPSEYTRKQ